MPVPVEAYSARGCSMGFLIGNVLSLSFKSSSPFVSFQTSSYACLVCIHRHTSWHPPLRNTMHWVQHSPIFYLSVHLAVSAPVSLPDCLGVNTSECFSAFLAVHLHCRLAACQPDHLPASLFAWWPVYLPDCVPVLTSVCQSVHSSLCTCTHPLCRCDCFWQTSLRPSMSKVLTSIKSFWSYRLSCGTFQCGVEILMETAFCWLNK